MCSVKVLKNCKGGNPFFFVVVFFILLYIISQLKTLNAILYLRRYKTYDLQTWRVFTISEHKLTCKISDFHLVTEVSFPPYWIFTIGTFSLIAKHMPVTIVEYTGLYNLWAVRNGQNVVSYFKLRSKACY